MQLFHHDRPDTRVLCRVGLDRWFSLRQLERLALHADVVEAPAGRVLSRAGSAARELLVVGRGVVEIADAPGQHGAGRRGTIVGAYELIAGVAHRATVTARTDVTLVAIFGPAFRWEAIRSGSSLLAPVPVGDLAALWDEVRTWTVHRP
ncbi:MAG: cyclic nucleotide-binding domain-containing protein [Ilumatobacteraceae bacterium]